jgi:hypothetical protein
MLFRRFHPTPGHLLALLLAVEGILLLSNWLHWIPKGWSVLFAIAAVTVMLAVGLFWYLLALLFHWRFQFSIRSLLLLTVVVAIPFSWLAVEMNWAKKQRGMVEPLWKLGGSISYDFETNASGCTVEEGLLTPPPAWIRDKFSNDFFGNVTIIALSSSEITDDDLNNLEGLKLTPILHLYNTQITDAGLKHIEELKQLKILNLASNAITDAGLKHLESLEQLTSLGLPGNQISGPGIEHIRKMNRLKNLVLYETQITDETLAIIEGLKQLDSLVLSKTRITNDGLKHIKEMSQLERLFIDGNQITDVGLVELENLSNLRYLCIRGTQVSDAGVDRLRKALPHCQIEY